jgi:hypothetical protein
MEKTLLEGSVFSVWCLLSRLEVTGRAAFLGRRGEALTFAGILALAGVGSALASALALTGIGANAVAHRFIGECGRGYDGIGKHERCRCGRNGRTRLNAEFHGVVLLEGLLFHAVVVAGLSQPR